MKRLEDLIADKLSDLINYILSKIIKPDITLKDVTELDEKAVIDIKEKYGIEGIILDVDETLRKDMNQIPKCNKEWLENLRGQLKVIIVSNGMDREIEQYFRDREIDYISFAHKPLKMNFVKACKKLQVDPKKILVIGDSLFDDIYGGNRNGMFTAKVENVRDDEIR